MVTMCHPVYYQNCFVVTHALGQITKLLPIAGTNESTITTLCIRAFQIVLRGGRWVSPTGADESYTLLEGRIFLIGVWEPDE